MDNEKKTCWISWKLITSPKSVGGLGLKNILDFNLSLLGKWVWRYFNESDSLWASVIKVFYGKDGGFGNDMQVNGSSSTWLQLVKGSKLCLSKGIDISKANCHKVGNGKQILFWLDSWSPLNMPLCKVFPRLFALEMEKECVLAHRWRSLQNSRFFSANWRCTPRGRAIGELEELQVLIDSVTLDESKEDKKIWTLSSNGMFSVKHLYSLIQEAKGLNRVLYSHTWNHWVPLKVNILVWKARLNRLPTMDNLFSRKIIHAHGRCFLCMEDPESLEHSLFSCSKVIGVWKKIFAWWRLPFPMAFGWSSFLQNRGLFPNSESLFKVFHAVCCVGVWFIWRWRNTIAFADDQLDNQCRSVDPFPGIQSSSLLWIMNRSKHLEWNWSSWIGNPCSLT